MKITRKEFFQTTVNILFKERIQGSCTYREAIIKAQEELNISNEQLRQLCSKGIYEIYI